MDWLLRDGGARDEWDCKNRYGDVKNPDILRTNFEDFVAGNPSKYLKEGPPKILKQPAEVNPKKKKNPGQKKEIPGQRVAAALGYGTNGGGTFHHGNP